MWQWLRARPLMAISVALPAVAYVGATGAMVAQQRQFVFETNDGGRLAAAGYQAIVGGERVTLTTSDGETIAGWFVAPQPAHPVVLFLHGQGGMLVRQAERWQRMRQAGFGVLAISYRGYPGSTGSPTEAGLDLDARAAYDWLRTRYAVRDIVIQGHSLGSGVAVKLATDVEARALLLEAPFTAAVDVAAERMPWLPVNLLMFDQFRSRDVIGRVRCPVLIVHGERDGVISVEQGQRLFDLAPRPKQFVRVANGNHNSLSRDGLYTYLTQFLMTTAPK